MFKYISNNRSVVYCLYGLYFLFYFYVNWYVVECDGGKIDN